MNKLLVILVIGIVCGGIGCSSSRPTDVLNPFTSGDDQLGKRDNSALLREATGGDDAEDARHALEVMGSYRTALAPQPTYPVIRPAEVRLMWVPDHLNAAGDLVPAHYYYLKVKDDEWAVQDAFDIEEQLNGRGRGVSGSTATPWVYGNEK